MRRDAAKTRSGLLTESLSGGGSGRANSKCKSRKAFLGALKRPPCNTDLIPTLQQTLSLQITLENTRLAALTVPVVTTTALCLLFPETRWIGVAGAIVLSHAHPLLLCVLAALVALAGAFLFYLTKGGSFHA